MSCVTVLVGLGWFSKTKYVNHWWENVFKITKQKTISKVRRRKLDLKEMICPRSWNKEIKSVVFMTFQDWDMCGIHIISSTGFISFVRALVTHKTRKNPTDIYLTLCELFFSFLLSLMVWFTWKHHTDTIKREADISFPTQATCNIRYEVNSIWIAKAACPVTHNDCTYQIDFFFQLPETTN